MWWLWALAIAAAQHQRPRQINPVSVLLPYTDSSVPDHRVNVTLQAYGGCYRWRVQRPTIIKIRDLREDEVSDMSSDKRESIGLPAETELEPSDFIGNAQIEECHNAVMVSQFMNERRLFREKSWVFAEDIYEGDIGVKCEVYVTPIDSIGIESTAKSLTVGGVETLKIRALDKEGNVFTSLEGLRFQWEIEDPKVISIASLKNDIYRPTGARRHIHEKGEQSDIILLKGLQSGRTHVRARLLEPGYEDVPDATVWLDVIEPIVSVPSTVYAPPLSVFSLGLKVLKGKETPSQASLVRLPNPDFRFDLMPGNEADASELEVQQRHGRIIIKRVTARDNDEPYMIQVSDSRNANNTDITTIFLAEPYSFRLYHSPTQTVFQSLLNVDSDTKTETALETLSQRSSWPGHNNEVSESIKQMPGPIPSWRARRGVLGSAGPATSVWYLPQNESTVIGIEALTKEGNVMLMPENVRIEVSVLDQNGTNRTGSTRQWVSSTGNLAAFRPSGEVGDVGIIKTVYQSVFSDKDDQEFKPQRPVVVSQKYVIVDPIQIEGMPGMRRAKIDSEHAFMPASPVPIVLPKEYNAHFHLKGGSGNYNVHSSHPEVCSVATTKDNAGRSILTITTSKGSDGTIAEVIVADENNGHNYYRIHCFSGEVESIHYAPTSHQVPIDTSRAFAARRVPVRARARIPESYLETPPYLVWVHPDPAKRNAEESALLQGRDFGLFTQCQHIGLKPTVTPSVGGLKHASSRPEVTVMSVASAERELYECDLVELSMPDKPTHMQIFGTLALPDQVGLITTSTEIEFFSQLRAYIPAEERLKRLNLAPYLGASATVDETSRVTSSRFGHSTSMALGSTIEVNLLGGPSSKPECHRSFEYSVSMPNIVDIQHIQQPSETRLPSLLKDGAFRLTCLQKSALVEITFTLHSTCTEGDLSTKMGLGCSIPNLIRVVPDDSGQDYNVEPLAPLDPVINGYTSQTLGKMETQLGDMGFPSRIYATCDETHAFELVAWDSFRRPLVALGPFGVNWGLFDRQVKAKKVDEQPELSIHDSSSMVNLKGPATFCDRDTRVIGSLYFTGEVKLPQHVPRALTQALIMKFKSLLDGPWLENTYLYSGLEIHFKPLPRLLPVYDDIPVLYSFDWRYRLVHQFCSSKARYTVEGPGSIISVDTHEALSEVPETLSLLKAGETTLVDLVPDEALLQTPANAPKLRPFSQRLPTSYDDILVRPERRGNVTFTATDYALLGGKVLKTKMSFMDVTSLDIDIFDLAEGHLVATSRNAAGTVQELETDTIYGIKPVPRVGERLTHPLISRFLDFELLLSPNSDVELKPVKDITAVYSYTMRIPTVGLYSLATTGKERSLMTRVTENSAVAIDLMLHKRLRVQPKEMVLLPGGHTWELEVSGGGASMKSYYLESSDTNVVEVLEAAPPLQPRIRSINKGSAVVKILRGDRQPWGPNERVPEVQVNVGYPARAGVIVDDRLYLRESKFSDVVLATNRFTRIRGTLLNSAHQQFTPGNLIWPNGPSEPLSSKNAGQAAYACKYTWHSLSPETTMLLAEEEGDMTGTVDRSTNKVEIRMTPPLTNKVSSHSRLSVNLFAMTPGTGRVTFTAECADRQKWGSPFSRWVDSVTFVTFQYDEGGPVKELDAMSERTLFSDIRYPQVVTSHGQYSVLDKLLNATGWRPPTYRSDRVRRRPEVLGPHMHIGEPLRLVPGGTYSFSPSWDGAWNHSMVCYGEGGVAPTPKPCGPGTAITKHLGMPKTLELVVGTSPNLAASVALRGGGMYGQTAVISLITADVVEAHVVPSNHPGHSNQPNLQIDETVRPLRLRTGETKSFKILLRDSHRREVFLPDQVEATIISSHPSVAKPHGPSDPFWKKGVFDLVAGTEGCASITVSVPVRKRIVSDVVMVCVSISASMPVRSTESEFGSEGPSILSETSVLTRPWTESLRGGSIWTILLIIGVTLLLLSVYFRPRKPEPQVPVRAQVVAGSPIRAPSSSPIKETWGAAAGTGSPQIGGRTAVSAFPKSRRLYANPPGSGGSGELPMGDSLLRRRE